MVETGHFATLWNRMATKLGLVTEFVPTDWRRGADPAAIEAKLTRGPRATRSRRCASCTTRPRPGRRAASGSIRKAIDAARHPALLLVDTISFARLDRLPPRRMGRGRHRGRLAEGADAAARPFVQRGEREGAQGFSGREAAAVLLGLGGDARVQQDRLLPLHAGDEPALRAARGVAHAAGGGPGECLRAPRPPCRGDAPRGARLGPRGPVRGAGGVFEFAHGGDDAAPATTPITCAR